MNYKFIPIVALVIIVGLLTIRCKSEPAPSKGETREIIVYFNRSEPTEIVQVEVKRAIAKAVDPATGAINELLKGPTDSEKADGLTTAISEDTILNYVKIENGIATVDFNEKFDFQMGGSARVTAIRAQIEKTLFQFPELAIKKVLITVNHGERPAVLEP